MGVSNLLWWDVEQVDPLRTAARSSALAHIA